jgi:hypothetical protein
MKQKTVIERLNDTFKKCDFYHNCLTFVKFLLESYSPQFNDTIMLLLDFILKTIEIDSGYRKQLSHDFLALFLANIDLINDNGDPVFIQFLYDCFSRIIETEAYYESDTKFIRSLLHDLLVRVFEDTLKALNFYLIISKVINNFHKTNVR